MRVLGIDPGYAIVGWGVVEYISNRYAGRGGRRRDNLRAHGKRQLCAERLPLQLVRPHGQSYLEA